MTSDNSISSEQPASDASAITGAKPARKRRIALVVAVAILSIGAIAFVASRVGLDRALVKEMLDNAAANIKQQSDGAVNFTYDDVSIAGSLLDRHAVVSNPVITQHVPEGMSEDNSFRLTTKAVTITPGRMGLSSFTVSMPHPLITYKGTQKEPELTVTQKAPVIIAVDRRNEQGRDVLHTHTILPDAFLVDGSADERDQAWNQLTITLDAGGTVDNSYVLGDDALAGLGNTTLRLSNLKVTPQDNPDAAFNIASVASDAALEAGEGKKPVFSIDVAVGPIEGKNEHIQLFPMEFALNASIEGDAALPEASNGLAVGDSAFKLKNFKIKTKDIGLFATADFVSGTKDVLPVGTANITIENALQLMMELKNNKVVSPKDEQLINNYVLRITGKDLASSKDISIDIKRVRDGAFQIGQSTFEELLALAFGAVMAPSSAPSAPDVPSIQAVPNTAPNPASVVEPVKE